MLITHPAISGLIGRPVFQARWSSRFSGYWGFRGASRFRYKLPIRAFSAGRQIQPPRDYLLKARSKPKDPDHAEAAKSLDEYDPNVIEELPINYGLGRTAARRNAAKARINKDPYAEISSPRTSPGACRQTIGSAQFNATSPV
ncbi:hypothetical protein KD146_07455 [Devosia sp. BSSL-BM10]|uniref:Uncharacterized protein n=1 Tax=Devosia litorisediminis TaxID=2829817 RepID=A0A942EEX3_9HYPH|nr:hypothetical protein [Devosia litorisediminis]MBS3848536.1 hypothetical protein [Devosia litorisediminis]